MKKIGIDARLLGQTGVGVYIRNLLYQLEKRAAKDTEFYVYVLPEDHFQISNFKFQIREAPFSWHSLTEQVGFLQLLLRDNLDLMHFTYFSYPVLYMRKFVTTVHDLTPLLFKTGKASTKNPVVYSLKHAIFRYVLSSQIKNAVSIITPTRTVKDQIIKHFGRQHESKIHPIWEGVDERLLNAKGKRPEEISSDTDFLLYVGNFYPHKNVKRLIKAFSKVKANCKLVLVGPHDYFARDIMTLINNLNQQARIIVMHDTTPENFVWLYQNAKALVHPSLSEGFGLPIVEASHFTLPVIASNIPVFDELLGKDRLSFEPLQVNAMAEALRVFYKNPQAYKNQYIPAKKLTVTYSFSKMARHTLEVYRKAM